MVNTIILTLITIVILFSFVVLFGAPYLPTLKQKSMEVFDLIELKKGQTLVELGSGDGRILKIAAQKGMYAIGYELNPLLVVYSMISCWPYRQHVRVKWANYWRHTLPQCDGLYVFLLNPYMEKLGNKISNEMKNDVKVVSFAFKIPQYKVVKEQKGLYLYKITPTRH
ncbi:MAG: hypothetical protein NVSMB46_09970 [Candidatus Saccharimonadales bacterium]